jgi:hypothetical protein
MDEADAFIESCEAVNYQPFDELKDIQNVGVERFKFVVAGLRNIVRFKRDIVLGKNNVITHMDFLTITPFSVMEAKQLLEIPLFYLGFRFSEEQCALVAMILATTNYFPGLLQLYCAKLLEAMLKSDYGGYDEYDTPAYEVKESHIKKVISEAGFQQQIREKFMITLKLDDDNYYYILALLVASLYRNHYTSEGYSVTEVIQTGRDYGVEKISALSEDKVFALMEEMRELNVLRMVDEKKYLFASYHFFEMMGTKKEIEDKLMEYMED